MGLSLETPVCGLLGCRYPIVLAGMGGVARSDLVAAVSEAGGFGFLGMVRESPDFIRTEVARVRARTTRGFGVNLIPAATDPDLLEAEVAAVIEAGIPAVALFWDLKPDLVRRLLDAGCLVLAQIGSVREAEEAAAAGAHIVIAQGTEAGGHLRGQSSLATLVPDVVGRVEVPVLAAGGIVDGAGVAAMLALGAQGAVIGTAFLATHESFAHDYHKDRVLQAQPGDTVRTCAFHINWPPGASVRVLPNSVTRGERGDPSRPDRRVIGEDEGRCIFLFSTDSPLRSTTGDLEAMALYAGEGAGRIGSLTHAAGRLAAIVDDARRLLERSEQTEPHLLPQSELSSPACMANEAADSYMGYADRAEIVAFLNELLEAERAGTRVALQSALATDDVRIVELMRAIHKDEARWCAALLRHIKALNATPSRNVGAFYLKAMAIEDLGARIAFLNRGQGWVVRKLKEMLPRVRDDRLHCDLAEMLWSHEANIERATEISDRIR